MVGGVVDLIYKSQR